MKKIFFFVVVLLGSIVLFFMNFRTKERNPLIAIANYGPHPSLEEAIRGFKEQMIQEGFIEGETISYVTADVGFDPTLISPMLLSLKAKNPQIIVVMTTLVAQIAKSKIRNIPLIYSAVTDPVEAGLIKQSLEADENMTGSSDVQDVEGFLRFIKLLLPNAKNVGVLYVTSDSQDARLTEMMQFPASHLNMFIIPIPVEQARDVPVRIQKFRRGVDFIYMGSGSSIQSAISMISLEAKKMHIPLFDVNAQAVRDSHALASYGVNYTSVGQNTGKLVAKVLRGSCVKDLLPIYPMKIDYCGLVNKKLAVDFNVTIPRHIETVE